MSMIFNVLRIASRRPQTAEYIAANGLDSFEIERNCGAIGAIKCLHRGGRFKLSGEGEWSIGIPVNDEYGEVIDAVAWSIYAPTRFGTAFGIADALGMGSVTNPATWAFGQNLQIFRTPLEWLQAGCDGCVILDYRALPSWLGTVPGSISIEDRQHAELVYQGLNPPRFEKRRIFVRRDPLEQAA